MKKTIAIILALCCYTIVMAQNAYRDLVQEFQMLSNGEHAREMVLESYSKLAVQKGLSADAANAAAVKFYDNEMYPTMINMAVEAFQGKVTEDDLKQIIKEYKTPAGKTALENSLKCSSPENQQKLQAAMMPGVQSVIMGGAIQNVQAPACSASYKQKFSTYYKLANMSSTFDAIISTLMGALQAQMSNADAEAMIGKIKNFFNDNSENIMLHACVDALTESDLDFFNKVLDTEAGKRVTEASQSITAKSAAYGVQSVTDFMNSLGN